MLCNVFVSSTVADLEALRRQVQDAIGVAGASCHLSEDWATDYDDTVAQCWRHFSDANSFMLLLGHWYGSTPPGHEHSITSLEFEWAMKRREQESRRFPMAVFMPEHESPADRELRELAEPLVKAKFEAGEHERLLGELHRRVTDSWRTVRRFRDVQQLREYTIVICMDWRGETPLAEAQRALGQPRTTPAPAAAVSDAKLGALGREAQLRALRTALAESAGRADAPAVAFLVHGDEGAGHRAFLHCLVDKPLKSLRPKDRVGQMQASCTDAAKLCAAVGQALGLPGATPEALADSVAAELRSRSLAFVFDRIGRYPGGAAGFHADFWRPFHARLVALKAANRFDRRLVAVLAAPGGHPDAWSAAASVPTRAQGAVDYGRLLALPRLGAFEREDVRRWLAEEFGMDAGDDRQAEIVERAMRDGDGEDDPVPLHVFERLRGEALADDQGDVP
jgi:hypothetical protein